MLFLIPWSETAIVLSLVQDGRKSNWEKYLLDVVPLRVTLDRAEGVTTEAVHVTAAELRHAPGSEKTQTDRKP